MGRWAASPLFTCAHSLKSCNGRGKRASIPEMPPCPQSPLFLETGRLRNIFIACFFLIRLIWQNHYINPYSAQTRQFPFCCAFAVAHAQPAGIAQNSSGASWRISPDNFSSERFRQDYVFSHTMRFLAETDTVDASIHASVHILKTAHAMLLNEKPDSCQNRGILRCANSAALGKPVSETDFNTADGIKFWWQYAKIHGKRTGQTA